MPTPYVIPLNHTYANGKIVFHCAHTGKNQCMQPGAPEITREAAAGCTAVEITISEMIGRQQRGTDHMYYRCRFP